MLGALGRSITSWPWEPPGLRSTRWSGIVRHDFGWFGTCLTATKEAKIQQIKDGKLHRSCKNPKEICMNNGCQVCS